MHIAASYLQRYRRQVTCLFKKHPRLQPIPASVHQSGVCDPPSYFGRTTPHTHTPELRTPPLILQQNKPFPQDHNATCYFLIRVVLLLLRSRSGHTGCTRRGPRSLQREEQDDERRDDMLKKHLTTWTGMDREANRNCLPMS